LFTEEKISNRLQLFDVKNTIDLSRRAGRDPFTGKDPWPVSNIRGCSQLSAHRIRPGITSDSKEQGNTPKKWANHQRRWFSIFGKDIHFVGGC